MFGDLVVCIESENGVFQMKASQQHVAIHTAFFVTHRCVHERERKRETYTVT